MRGVKKTLASFLQLSALDDYLCGFTGSDTLYQEHFYQSPALPNVQGDA